MEKEKALEAVLMQEVQMRLSLAVQLEVANMRIAALEKLVSGNVSDEADE